MGAFLANDLANARVAIFELVFRFWAVGFNFRICSSCQRLMDLRKKCLEDTIDHFFSRAGGLDEPQTAGCDRLSACGE